MSVHKLNFTFKRGKNPQFGVEGLGGAVYITHNRSHFDPIFCITLQKMKNNTTEKWKLNHNWHFTSYVKTKNKPTNMKTQSLKKVRVHQRYSGAVLSVLMWSCSHRCSQCEETQSSPSAAQIRTQAQNTAQYNEAAVNVSIVAESRWGEVSPPCVLPTKFRSTLQSRQILGFDFGVEIMVRLWGYAEKY